MSNCTQINEIVDAEERLRLAMLSSDVRALETLLSSNLIFTNHLGQLMSKDDDLAAHEKGDFHMDELSLSEQIIRVEADVVIVSVYAKITGSYQGVTANGDFRFTRVWHKSNNQWQVLAGHACLVA